MLGSVTRLMEPKAFGDLLAAIYGAAMDSPEWGGALGQLRAAFPGSGIAVIHHDLHAWAAFGGVVGVHPEALDKYSSGYAAMDPYRAGVESKLPCSRLCRASS